MKLEDFLRLLPMEAAFVVRSVLEGAPEGVSSRLNVENVKLKLRGWTITLKGITAECGTPPVDAPFVPQPAKGGGS